MKSCIKCIQLRIEEDFPFRNKVTGSRQKTCKFCQREYGKAWFKNNKDRHAITSARASKKYRIKKRGELADAVNKIKSVPCMDCNVSYAPWIMQFDHRDPSIKEFNVAAMVHDLKPLEAILNEISKCDVVCANCHANRTYLRRNQ